MRPANVLAATRPAQVVVTCFGHVCELTPGLAADWVGAIGYDLEGLSGVFPGRLQEDDLDWAWEASTADPTDTQRRWRNVARVAVGRASGRDWWWTVNLVRKCLPIWPYINGQLLLHNVDAAATPLPSWLDAAFMLLWTNADQEGRTRLDMELSMRPKGVAVSLSPQTTRRMLDDFAAD